MKSKVDPAKLLGIAAIVAVGLVMLRLSWLKAPDILIDFGRELYVPWQLSEGKLLYRDIIYWNGPVTPYLNALVFLIFGLSIHTLLSFNIFIIALITLVIYKLFKDGDDGGDLLAAPLAAIVFLSLFAFAQYYRIGGYNFAAPYSHELTHGILISLTAIYLIKRYLGGRYLLNRRALTLALIGFLVGLSLLTKVEIFAALFGASLMALFCALWVERPSGRGALKGFLVLVGGFFLPLVLSLIALGPAMGLSGALKGVLGSWYILAFTDIGAGNFQWWVMGLDEAAFNSRRLLVSLLWYLSVFSPLALAAYLLERGRSKRGKGVLMSYAPALVALITATFTGFFIRYIWSEILRPLPLFMAILLIVFFILLVRYREDKERAYRIIGEMAFVAFALMMLMKIFLKVHVTHYGFALAMPAALVLVKALTVYIPAALREAAGERSGKGLSPLFRFGALGALFSVIVFHSLIINQAYGRKDYAVGSGADTMIAYGPDLYPYGRAVNRTLNEIERSFAPDATFVVFPEGATLNFLSKRENPSGFLNFNPSEVTMFGEEEMLKALERSAPDYILKVHMDTTEYGYRFFGVDYALMLEGWIRENYSPVFLTGREPLRDESFGILIMERNGADKSR